MDVVDPQNPLGPKIRLHNPFHSYQLQGSPWLTMPNEPTEYAQKVRNSQPFNISRGA